MSTTDLPKVQEYYGTWYAAWDPSYDAFKARGNLKSVAGRRPATFLHRWITDAPAGLHVDHINHDSLDNRRCNLRVVTCAQNCQNRQGASGFNRSSGVRGVSFDREKGLWRVRVGRGGRNIQIGYFEAKEEAARAASEARRKLMPFSEMDKRVAQ